MNIFKGCLSTLYIPILLILGAVVGLIVGFILPTTRIWWSKYEIDTNDLNIQEIMFVSYDEERGMYAGRVAKDTVYVKTIDDQIYSFSMADESWQLANEDVSPTPGFGPLPCSREWMYPPVRQPIKDDEGGVRERPLMTETICYVLLENGRLQYWYHQINVYSMMFTLGVFSVLGFIGGGITSFFVRRRLKAKKNEVGEENENYND